MLPDLKNQRQKHIELVPFIMSSARVRWEDIYQFILDSKLRTSDRSMLIEYFRKKTTGYKNGILQKAFSISH
ncbi:MAG: hypothetical protein ABSF24_09530 [Candidatus Bathyarchaeia archaeon]|jgi:hypothetical protein